MATATTVNDIERAHPYATSLEEKDPFSLKSGLKTSEELNSFGRTSAGKKALAYHRKQNLLIENLLLPLEDHVEQAKESEAASKTHVRDLVR